MEMGLIASNLNLIPHSLVNFQGSELGLALTSGKLQLVILAEPGAGVIEKFDGESSELAGRPLVVCPLSNHNATRLRKNLPWLQPKLLGLQTSAGMGDRLGIATPGHVRAMRKAGAGIAPVFAQQSIREMKRTGRSPQQVLDDVTWGMFEEGWQAGTGADADHLKTKEDIEACLEAGFTFFTFDPGDYVHDSLPATQEILSQQLQTVPVQLHPTATGLLGKKFDVEGYNICMEPEVLYRAVAKYGSAISHVVDMYRHLANLAGGRSYEVEVSMDETGQPTSPAEHVYIASELKRLGVRWVSFAPRFIGRFEKGVDYIGDLSAFRQDLAVHAAIARQFGPYKLSLHSGSDKFSIYSIFMEETRGLAHVKTAGTSYLEALRTIAQLDRDFFEEIYRFALDRYEVDKHSYHVSADISRVPKPGSTADWNDLFEQFDVREILHVTFGSVLTDKSKDGSPQFYDRLMGLLKANREAYFENLERHFTKHLQPFSDRLINKAEVL